MIDFTTTRLATLGRAKERRANEWSARVPAMRVEFRQKIAKT